MIEDGLQIMVIGMVTVFCFLGLMVLVMNVSTWVFGRWGGDDDGASVAAVIAAARAYTDRLGE